MLFLEHDNSTKHYVFFVEVTRNNEDVELTADEKNKVQLLLNYFTDTMTNVIVCL